MVTTPIFESSHTIWKPPTPCPPLSPGTFCIGWSSFSYARREMFVSVLHATQPLVFLVLQFPHPPHPHFPTRPINHTAWLLWQFSAGSAGCLTPAPLPPRPLPWQGICESVLFFLTNSAYFRGCRSALTYGPMTYFSSSLCLSHASFPTRSEGFPPIFEIPFSSHPFRLRPGLFLRLLPWLLQDTLLQCSYKLFSQLFPIWRVWWGPFPPFHSLSIIPPWLTSLATRPKEEFLTNPFLVPSSFSWTLTYPPLFLPFASLFSLCFLFSLFSGATGLAFSFFVPQISHMYFPGHHKGPPYTSRKSFNYTRPQLRSADALFVRIFA